MSATPQHPFSAIIAMKILELIRARDLELVKLRNSYQAGETSLEELKKALEASEAKITDDVFEVCVKNIQRLEATVDRVLQIQRQMAEMRAAAADNIVPPSGS